MIEGAHRAATLHVREEISNEERNEETRSKTGEQEGKGPDGGRSEQRREKEGRRTSSTTEERKDEMVCFEALKEISRLKETWEKGLLSLSSCHCLSLYSAGTSLSTSSFCTSETTCFPSSSAVHQSMSKGLPSSSFSTWRQAAVWLESQAGHVLLLLELVSNHRKKKTRRISFDTEERPNESTWREPELSLSFSSSSFSLLEQLEDHFTRFLPLTAEALQRVWQLEDIRLQTRCWGPRLSKDFLSRTDGEQHLDYSDKHENKKRNMSSDTTGRLQRGNECELSSSCRSSPPSRVLLQLYQESYSLLSALCDELKRQEKASYEKGISTEEDQGGTRKKTGKTQGCESDGKNLTAAGQPEGTSSLAVVKTDSVVISRKKGRDEEKKGEDSGETTERRVTRKSLIDRLVGVLKQQSSTFAMASGTLVADQPNEKGDVHFDSSLSSGTVGASPNRRGVVRDSVQAMIGEENDHRERGGEQNGARLSSSFPTSENEVLDQLRELQREMDAARAFLSRSGKSTQVTREEEKQEKKSHLSERRERGQQGDPSAREEDSKNQIVHDGEDGDLLVSPKSSSLPPSSGRGTEDRCVSTESMEGCRPGYEQGEDSSPRKKEHREATRTKKKDDIADQFSDVSLDIEEIWSLEGSSFEPSPSEEENEEGDQQGKQHDKKKVKGFLQHRQREGQHQASLKDGERYRSDKDFPRSRRSEEDKEKIRDPIERRDGVSLKTDQPRATLSPNRTLLEEETERRIRIILMACRRARQEKQSQDSLELFFEEESSPFSPLSPMYFFSCDRIDIWADKSRCFSHRRSPLEICRKSIQDFLYDDYRLHSAYRDYLPSLLSPPSALSPPPSLSYLSPSRERSRKRAPLSQITEHLRDKDRHPVSPLEREEALNGWRMINQARLRSGGTLPFWWYCTTLAYMVNSPTSLFHLRREIFICGKESPYTEKWMESDAKEVRTEEKQEKSGTKRMNEVRGKSHTPPQIEKEDLEGSPVLCMSGETWIRGNYATQRRLERREGFWRDDQEEILIEDSDLKYHPCEGRIDDVIACREQEEEKPTREREHPYEDREETDDDSERRFWVEGRQRRKIRNSYNDLREDDDDDDGANEEEDDLPPPEAWSLFWGSETEDGTHSRKNKRRKTRRTKVSRREQEGFQDSHPSHSRRSPLASQEGYPVSEEHERVTGGSEGGERHLIASLSNFYPSGDNRMKRKTYTAGGETYMTIDLDLVSVVTHLSKDAERELEELLPLLPSRPSSLDQCRRAFYQLAQVSSI